MIAFGVSVSETKPYRRYAEPGIRLAAEADSRILALAPAGLLPRSLNLVLAEAGRYEDLEALVLVHTYTEIVDSELCAKVRMALADPDMGVIGPLGARGATSIAWWEGEVSSADVTFRYGERGGGEWPAYEWADPGPAPAEVDVVDGSLMVLSPWVVRNMRFDETLRLAAGVEVDFCRRVRGAGRKIATFDAAAVLHRSLTLVPELESWIEAHVQMADRWAPEEVDWKARARRAEAESEAARALAYAHQLVWDARVDAAERSLDELTSTLSWRLTRPLRELNRRRRETRAG
jgi:hypothetical protein